MTRTGFRIRWTSVVILIVCLVFVAAGMKMCAAARGRSIVMGYSNGKECWDGECRLKTTLEDALDCCADRCPQWLEECTAIAIDKFGGDKATKKLTQYARTIKSATGQSGPEFVHAVEQLNRARSSEDKTVRAVAVALTRSIGRETGREGLFK